MPQKKRRTRGVRTTAVQTIILSKDKYPTKREATTVARRHGFRTTKVDEPARGTSFRFRQENPEHFARFITRELFPGAVAVIGYYKPAHYKHSRSRSSRGSKGSRHSRGSRRSRSSRSSRH